MQQLQNSLSTPEMGLGAVGSGSVTSGRQPAEPWHLGEQVSRGSSTAFSAREEPKRKRAPERQDGEWAAWTREPGIHKKSND